jgi:prophage regulatory protein
VTRKLESPRKLVDYKGLKMIFGVPYGRTHLARMEIEGKFPKRVTLGANRVSWVASEIAEWVEAKIASRGAISE